MKVKNSYLKLMLWTLAGAGIGGALGAGMILFAKNGEAAVMELIYSKAVRATVWIQLAVWLLTGGVSLFLMNKAKKLAPLAESDGVGSGEKGRRRPEYGADAHQCQSGDSVCGIWNWF